MRRKLFLSLVMLIVATACSIGLFACSIIPKSGDQQEPQIVTYEAELIKAEGFTINSTAKTGKVTVAFGIESIKLDGKVTVSAAATWVVSATNAKSGAIANKTISLKEGDNTYYIIVTSGDEKVDTTYTITVHRRNMFTVSFDVDGGSEIEAKRVEEGHTLNKSAIEAPTKLGYTFDGWTYNGEAFDLNTSITSNITLKAKWAVATVAQYKVEYYLQKEDLSGYDADKTDTFVGNVGAEVKAEPEGYPHFNISSTSTLSGTVNAEGSLVLKVYYDRVSYTVSVAKNLEKATVSGGGEYINAQEVKITASEVAGYTFNGWFNGADQVATDLEYTFNPTSDITLTAKWTPISGIKYVVEYYQQNLSSEEFTLVDSAELSGTMDEVVRAEDKAYPHFNLDTEKSILSGTIAADGSLVLKAYYLRNYYNVSLAKNLEKGTVSGGGNYANAQEVKITASEVAGYTFNGWFNGADLVMTDLEYTFNPTSDITLTARWTAQDREYKVEYYFENIDDEDYTIVTTRTQNLIGKTDEEVSVTPAIIGHFTYNASLSTISGTVAADDLLVLKVYYTRDTYTVTFNGNGIAPTSGDEEQTVKYQGAAVAPEYEKLGYTYAFDRSFNEITGNITVKAIWTARNDTPYKIEYYKQNVADDEFSIDENLSKDLEGTTDSTVTVNPTSIFGFAYNEEGSIVSGKVAADGSLVLKLYYVRKTYSVTFSGNGGSLDSGTETQTVKYEGGAVAPVYKKVGYTFSGFDVSYDNIQNNVIASANWTPNTDTKYTVKVYLQNLDGNGYTEDETHKENKTGTTDATVEIETEDISHFTVDGEKSVVNGIIAPDGSLVLNVYYTRNTYTVTFNGNGGTLVSGNIEQTVKYQGAAVAPAYTRAGYTFEGFDVDLDNVEEDIEVTANWTANTDTAYTVEHYLQNVNNDEYTIDPARTENLTGTTDTTATATAATITGFTPVAESVSDEIAGDGSLVLKLYYTRDTFTVTFNGNGGTLVSGTEVQTVKYQGAALAPDYKLIGFKLDGFDKVFDNVTENLTVTAIWTPTTDTPYTVETYLQNVSDDGYALDTAHTNVLYGTTGASVTVTADEIENFTYNAAISTVSGTIAPDGSLVLKLYYTRDTFTVTFNGNGGTIVSGTEVQTVKYQGAAIAPVYEKAGYVFNGFDKTFDSITEAITVTAKWIAATDTAYTVEYYFQNTEGEGYTLDTDRTQNLTGTTGNIATVAVESIEYFTLNTGKGTLSGTIAPDGSLVLELYYDRNTYAVSITAENNLVTLDPSYVGLFRYGAEISDITAIVDETAEFDGWYIGGEKVSSELTYAGFTVKENITIVAKASKKTANYTVKTYLQNLNDDEYTMSSETFSGEVGSTVSVYHTGVENYTADTSESTLSGTIAADGSLVLSLYYNRKIFTVTFDGGEGTLVSGDEVQKVRFEGSAVAPTYERAGYTYIFEADFTNVAENLYVPATWIPNDSKLYTVKVYLQNKDDDEYTVDSSSHEYAPSGSHVSVTPETKIGFTYNADLSTVEGTVLEDESLVLSVYYTRNSYTVTFNGNGGTLVSGDEEQIVKYGVAAVAPVYERAGYTYEFDADCDEIVDDITINAVWTANTNTQYTVNVYLQNKGNDEYALLTSDTLTGTTDTMANAAHGDRTGFTFNEGISKVSGNIAGDGSLVLEVYYTRNTYTVTFNGNGGILVSGDEEQIVKYECSAVAPVYEKAGYIYEFDKAFNSVTENMTVTANWTAQDRAYNVEYYFENIDDSDYTIDADRTQNLIGKTDEEVSVTPESIGHFTYNASLSTISGTVAADGSLVLKVYYTRDTYTVTFNGNGGTRTGGGAEVQTVKYEGSAVAPVYTKAGYTYEFDKAFNSVTESMTVTANWERVEVVYTVKVYQQNKENDEYTLTSSDTFVATVGEEVTADVSEIDHFTFNDEISTTSGTVLEDGSLVLEIYYTRNTYTVTFDGNGGKLVSGTEVQTVKYEGSAVAPVYTKAGYTYEFDAEFDNIEEDITVTAVWTARDDIEYTVEVYKQNLEDDDYTLDSSETLTGTMDAEVTADVSEIEHFTFNPDESTVSGTIVADGSLVLKIYYTRDTYTVTFDGVEGTLVSGDEVQTVKYQGSAVAPVYERAGYTYIFDAEFDNIEEDITITAEWTARDDIAYTVEVYLQNLDDDDYKLDSSETLTGTTDEYVEADVADVEHFTFNDVISIVGGEIAGDGSLVLKLYYDREVYTVTFDGNGGTHVSGDEVQTVKYQGAAVAPTYERAGYTFTGYNVSFDSVIEDIDAIANWTANTDTAYTVEHYLQNVDNDEYTIDTARTEILAGTTDTTATATAATITGFTYNAVISTASGKITADGSLVLKLYYTRDTFTVTFNGNGGTLVSGTEVQTVKYEGSAVPPVYTKAGYTYEFDKAFDSVTENMTVTANWTADTHVAYKVEYYLENFGNDEYTKDNTLSKTLYGTTDQTVSVTPESIEHFTYNASLSTVSGTVAADGSLVLKVYYTRNKYLVSISSANEDVTLSNTYNSEYKYNAQISAITATVNGYLGYEWSGWYINDELVSSVLTYEAFRVSGPITIVAKSLAKAEMSAFTFTSTATTCIITGLTDKSVKTIVVPDYVTSISDGAFDGAAIETATVPMFAVTAVKSTSLKTLTITNGTAIPENALEGCTALSSVTIPSTVKSIGANAFKGCTALTSVTLPSGLTSIGNYAFSESGLTSISIPNTVTSLGEYAFYRCYNMTQANIPTPITEIPAHLFNECQSLANITINDGITSIGDYAFRKCTSLTTITIPLSVTYLGAHAFEGCTSLATVLFEGESSYTRKVTVTSGLSDFTKTGSNVSISASSDDYVLASNLNAWGSRINSKKVTFDGLTVYFKADNYNGKPIGWGITNSSTGYSVVEGTSATPYFNATIRPAGTWAFMYYQRSHAGENSGTVYHQVAYSNSTLTETAYGVDGTSKYGFGGEDSGVPTTLAYSVKFEKFNSAGTVYKVTTTGITNFGRCNSEVTYVSSSYIPDTGYICVWGMESGSQNIYVKYSYETTVTSGVEMVIGEGAFSSCTALATIALPDGVPSIGNYAFQKCTALTTIDIPETVTSIGNYAFDGCSNLAKVNFKAKGSTDTISTSTSDLTVYDLGGGATPSTTQNDTYVNISDLNTFADRVNSKSAQTMDGLTVYFKVTGYNGTPIGFGLTTSANGYSVPTDDLDANTTFNATIRTSDNFHFLYFQLNHAGEAVSEAQQHMIAYRDAALTDTTYGIDGTRKYAFTKGSSFEYSLHFEKQGSVYKITITGLSNMERCNSYVTYVSAEYIPDTSYLCFWGMESGTQVFSVKFGHSTSTANFSIGSNVFTNCPKLTNYTFAGTTAQWAVVGKGSNWKDSSVTATVTCSNGTITV